MHSGNYGVEAIERNEDIEMQRIETRPLLVAEDAPHSSDEKYAYAVVQQYFDQLQQRLEQDNNWLKRNALLGAAVSLIITFFIARQYLKGLHSISATSLEMFEHYQHTIIPNSTHTCGELEIISQHVCSEMNITSHSFVIFCISIAFELCKSLHEDQQNNNLIIIPIVFGAAGFLASSLYYLAKQCYPLSTLSDDDKLSLLLMNKEISNAKDQQDIEPETAYESLETKFSITAKRFAFIYGKHDQRSTLFTFFKRADKDADKLTQIIFEHANLGKQTKI